MKVFFSLFFLFTAVKARALDCELAAPWVATTAYQFGYEDHRSANRRVLEVGVDCEKITPMTELFQAMLNFMPSNWPMPDHLVLNVTNEAANAYVNGNRVNIPFYFINLDKEKIPADKIPAIWGHEFAHVFFNSLMENKIPIMREYNDLYFSLLETKAQRAMALEDIPYFQAMGQSAVREYFDAQRSYRDANDEIIRIEKAIDQLEQSRLIKNINRVSKPYHEFFADLVTVIYFNNLKIISQSLKTNYRPEDDKDAATRDFSYAGNAIETWEGNIDDLKDSHHTMAASRYEVGQILQKQTLQENLILLDKIAGLVIEEILRQAQLDEREDPLELNRSFIEKFRQLN